MIRHEVAMSASVSDTRAGTGMHVGKIAIAAGFACVIGAFLYFDLGRFLSLGALQENRDHLLAFAQANYAAAVGIFILAYIAVTGLSLPGAVILKVGTLDDPKVFDSKKFTYGVEYRCAVGASLPFLIARSKP